MSTMIEDNIVTSTDQAFDQSCSFITYKLYRIFNTSNSLVLDNNLTSILRKDPKNYMLNDQIGDLYTLRSTLSPYQNNIDIFNIHIYVNKNFMYSNEHENIYPMDELENSKWLNKINSDNSRFFGVHLHI